MALNIFPREKKPLEPEGEPKAIVEEAVAPAGEDDAEQPRKRSRRGTRGGRGRGKAKAEGVIEAGEESAVTAPAEETITPAPASRRRARPAAKEGAAELEAPTPGVSGSRSRTRPAAVAPPAEGAQRAAAPRRKPREEAVEPAAGRETTESGTAAMLRAMDLQNRQIERLIHLQEEMAKRIGDGARMVAPPARVGVFVDAANVELAIDRLRTRLDWGKVMKMLTEGRQLVRAMAYSPIHDDPSVSMETQRFVEPFLDHGYKIVTKPLKRFADGTIKANVDIELALDVITMLDRLDVVCLVSGDGDFQRLVEVVQSRGVRVEVVGVGSSVAGNLRNAADTFIDLATRARELKV